jgi:PAS domain S-box-containing protein
MGKTATRVVLVAALAVLASPAPALDPARRITQLTRDVWLAKDGLPEGEINAIRQSADGYLWLGTRRGLVRFDGVRVRVYDAANTAAMPSSAVEAMALGQDGSVWSAVAGGVLRHQAGRFSFFGTDQGLHFQFPKALADEAGGCLYAGLGWFGVACLRDGRFSPYEPSRLSGVPQGITALARDRESRLWAGSSEGVVRFAPGAERPRVFTVRDGLRANGVRTLYVDDEGTLWAGTAAGLSRLEGERFRSWGRRDGLADEDVRALLRDRDGNLWVGTYAGGLHRFRDGAMAALGRDGGLADDAVLALAEDDEGTLWVGTGAGLNRLDEGPFTPYGLAEGLPAEDVHAVLAGRDRVWIADSAGNVSALRDGRIETVVPASSGLTAAGRSLAEGPDGSLWFAGLGALHRLRDGRVETIPGPARDAELLPYAVEKEGVLCTLGRPDGTSEVLWYAAGRFVPVLPGVTLRQANRLGRDGRGRLWVASAAGLHRFGPDGRRDFTRNDGIPRDDLTGFALGEAGTAWGGTRVGLVRIEDDRVTVYSARHGLPTEAPSTILEDGLGHLWVGWDGGVFRVAVADLDAIAEGRRETADVRVFRIADGLRSLATSWRSSGASRGPDGRVWFASARGVVSADPRRGKRSDAQPRVYVEELRADGEEVPVEGTPRVPAGRDRLEVHYTGLSYRAPRDVRFRHRLEGYDRDWVDAGGQRVAHYTNLPPGGYTFRVRAVSGEGVWNEEGAALAFSIAPHWYQTWWFDAGAGLAVLGLAFGAYRLRVRGLKARERALGARVDERTAELQREVGERRKAEEEIKRENEQRRAAEEGARAAAARLEESNRELTAHQHRLVAQQEALAQENEQRRRAEEEAGRERDLLRALMDNIPDLIFFKDTASRYTRVNRAQAEAFGLGRPEDAVGKSDLDFHPPEEARAWRRDEERLLATGEALVGKVQHDPRHDRYYLVTKVPLRAAAGTSGLVGIAKDITERRRAEEKLEQDLLAFEEAVAESAKGDLTRRAPGAEGSVGRIGRSVNAMLDGFATILAEARDAAFSVSSSSSEILAAATQIARGAQAGNDEVLQTSSAVEEMAASMARVAQNADHTARTAQATLDHVRSGERSVDATSEGMARVETAVAETADKMKLLEQRSRRVSEIAELIDEIAAQSKLLSLNAAIEAAHAGDRGGGFTVVADEMRRLADRSAAAARDVTEIVEGMVEEVKGVLRAMERSTREVREGRGLSEEARRSLREVSSLVDASARTSAEISAASREQAQATRTVASAMQAISTIATESATGASETSRAVRDLVRLSESLTAAISRFRLDGGRDPLA